MSAEEQINALFYQIKLKFKFYKKLLEKWTEEIIYNVFRINESFI